MRPGPSAGEVVLPQSGTVGQRKRELSNRVRPRFSDVVAADGNGIEVADLIFEKISLNIAHHFERNLSRRCVFWA